jgi:hypothetical protein
VNVNQKIFFCINCKLNAESVSSAR